MSLKCPRNPFQALFHIFVLPTISSSPLPTRAALSRPPKNTRALSSTPSRHSKPGAPERRTQKWDEQITARQIYLVDPETSRLLEQPQFTRDVLRRLDNKTQRLVQVSQDEPGNRNFTPVCKILSKAEIVQSAKRKKEAAREARRAGARGGEAQMKTIELNWAIDMNDLAHRLPRVKEFLGEGRRVEVVLAAKKQGRKASREECERVLARIREAVAEVPGAKEKPGGMEGKVGGLVKWMLVGKPPSSGTLAATAGGPKQEAGEVGETRGENHGEV